MSQTHLDKIKALNLGSFYTPDFVVKTVYDMLLNDLSSVNLSDTVLLDSSCGYGNFLRYDFLQGLKVQGKKDLKSQGEEGFEFKEKKMQKTLNLNTKSVKSLEFKEKIGIDIDEEALKIARQNFSNSKNPPKFLHKNSLVNVSRANFDIKEGSKLVIIGNPPYNDKTSIVQKSLKNDECSVDKELKKRDLGMSFLLSFEKLKADYMCVLHPLSYLIKESNFKALRTFFANYKLKNSLIISSQIFCPNSLGFFPIIIALYERSTEGISYEFIKHYSFKTAENKAFCLNDYEFISKFIDKYPNKKRILDSQKIAMFYTLRDINALRRSKTFIDKDCANAVYIEPEKYSLYCYVDVFKQILKNVPYYFGNCDVMIDFKGFKRLEKDFIKASNSKCLSPEITHYFENLLGEHYGK